MQPNGPRNYASSYYPLQAPHRHPHVAQKGYWEQVRGGGYVYRPGNEYPYPQQQRDNEAFLQELFDFDLQQQATNYYPQPQMSNGYPSNPPFGGVAPTSESIAPGTNSQYYNPGYSQGPLRSAGPSNGVAQQAASSLELNDNLSSFQGAPRPAGGSSEVAQQLNSSGIEKINQNFKNLLLTGKDSDVTLNVKGKKFSAHQLILKCQSTVFDSMFEHEMLEKTSGVVDITDCNPDVFKDFLLYLYCGEMAELSCNNVVDLHYIGNKYDVSELTTACVEFMISNISTETFCDFIYVGLQFEIVPLIESANAFLAQNFKQVFLTETWKNFLIENPNEGYTLMSRALKNSDLLPVEY